MDSYSQSLCAETKKPFSGHLWLIQNDFFVLPKRIKNIKKRANPPNSDSSAMYIVNNFYTISSKIIFRVNCKFKLLTHRFCREEHEGYVTRIVWPRVEFHPWADFVPVSGQTYLSVYMFNGGEISLLPLICPCLEDRGETHPVSNSAWF